MKNDTKKKWTNNDTLTASPLFFLTSSSWVPVWRTASICWLCDFQILSFFLLHLPISPLLFKKKKRRDKKLCIYFLFLRSRENLLVDASRLYAIKKIRKALWWIYGRQSVSGLSGFQSVDILCTSNNRKGEREKEKEIYARCWLSWKVTYELWLHQKRSRRNTHKTVLCFAERVIIGTPSRFSFCFVGKRSALADLSLTTHPPHLLYVHKVHSLSVWMFIFEMRN